jgi:hypothetical protein
MRDSPGTVSRARHIICPFCESEELALVGVGFARCPSCGLPLVGSTLETLREIVGLPDSPSETLSEKGYEQRSKRGFGRYTEHEKGQTASFRLPVVLAASPL